MGNRTYPNLLNSNIWLTAFVSLFWQTAVPASVQAQQNSEPVADAMIHLQSTAVGSVRHAIVDENYQVDVNYPIDLIRNLEHSVQFINFEPGTVSDLEVRCGDLVKPDPSLAKPLKDAPGEYKAEALKFNKTYHFAFKWDFDPNQAEREFQKGIEEIQLKAEQVPDLPDDPVVRQRIIDREIRKQVLATINARKPLLAGENRVASKMGTSTRFENAADSEQTLRDLYRWWAFDELLNHVNLLPPEGEGDSRKMKFAQEIMDVLSGVIAVDEATLLSPQEKNKLVLGCQAEIAFQFQPTFSEEDPDHRWRHAFRIRLTDDTPAKAVWTTRVGGDSNPKAEWLDLGTRDFEQRRPQLTVRDGRQTSAAMWVEGPNNELFLRIVPRELQTESTVVVEVQTSPMAIEQIEIPVRGSSSVKFPF